MFEWLGAIHWASPWLFLFLPPVVVAAVVRWRRVPPALKVSQEQELPGTRSSSILIRLPWALETAGMVCLVIALARPQQGIEDSKRRPRGIDIIIALDVSGSMDAVDVPRKYRTKEAMRRLLEALASKKDTDKQKALREIEQAFQFNELPSRLGVAKGEIAKFIDRRPNDRIGLVTFASDAYTVSPPTLDHSFLKGRLSRVKTGILDDTSTRIAPPILSAVSRLRDADSDRRVVLLFTDGANMRPLYRIGPDGKPMIGPGGKPEVITPVEAASMAKEFRIVIHTIGIGSRYGFVVDQTMHGRGVPFPISHFDPKLIKEIAATTDGQNFPAEDVAGMAEIMGEIDQLVTTARDQAQFADYKELFPYLVFAALAFIVTGFILDHTLLLRTP